MDTASSVPTHASKAVEIGPSGTRIVVDTWVIERMQRRCMAEQKAGLNEKRVSDAISTEEAVWRKALYNGVAQSNKNLVCVCGNIESRVERISRCLRPSRTQIVANRLWQEMLFSVAGCA